MLNAVELAQYVESAKQFYGALEELETALGATRFLTGDFVTEADAALYVTLVRFDLLYSRYLGPVKYRVQDLKNVSDYLKDLYQIPAFAHHTDFAAIIAREELRERKTASAPAHTTIWHFRRLTGMHSGRFRPSAPTCPQTRPIRSILETTADSTSTRPGTIWAQNLRKKRRKKRRRPADAAAADQIIDKK